MVANSWTFRDKYHFGDWNIYEGKIFSIRGINFATWSIDLRSCITFSAPIGIKWQRFSDSSVCIIQVKRDLSLNFFESVIVSRTASLRDDGDSQGERRIWFESDE